MSREAPWLCLGLCDDLVLAEGGRVAPGGLWLAWRPATRDLLLVRRGDAEPAGPDARYRRFHGADPAAMVVADWPAPRGRVEALGLLRAVGYRIPRGMPSPSKRRGPWIHHFGDRGARRGGKAIRRRRWPDRCMPILGRDRAGHLYIVRRPGNGYTVTDWIIG